MSGTPKINTSFSSSNYFDCASGIESLNTANASTKFGPVNFSVGVGVDTKTSLADRNSKVTNNLALEAKMKYNITDNLNTQARFRKIGDTEQYRVTFGGNYNFDKNNSIYSSAHLTTKHSNKGWNINAGAWVGYTHNFNGCSVSAELQQNIPFNQRISSSDTMLNVIFSIPF